MMMNLASLLLTIACLVAGYGFYKMNHGDVVNAACFTFGILGILLSFLRNRNSNEAVKKETPSDAGQP